MSGFYQGIAGGNGLLIVTSLKSPNFDPTEGTGWAINKDGTATFNAIDLPNVATGTTVTFSSTEPADPSNGDVWYNTSDGLAVEVYDGLNSTWVQYQIGTAAIADQAITTDLIADQAVNTEQLADGAVTGQQIADNAVGNAQLQDFAVQAVNFDTLTHVIF